MRYNGTVHVYQGCGHAVRRSVARLGLSRGSIFVIWQILICQLCAAARTGALCGSGRLCVRRGGFVLAPPFVC